MYDQANAFGLLTARVLHFIPRCLTTLSPVSNEWLGGTASLHIIGFGCRRATRVAVQPSLSRCLRLGLLSATSASAYASSFFILPPYCIPLSFDRFVLTFPFRSIWFDRRRPSQILHPIAYSVAVNFFPCYITSPCSFIVASSRV